MGPVAAVLTDIEGTTTPIAFVQATLFPYARNHLPAFLEAHAAEPEVAAVLDEVRHAAPDAPPLHTLLTWMDRDAKVAPLKTLQGMIWESGYASGALRGALYPDAAVALRRWVAGGLRLYVYSSGSVAAQRLIFAHSTEGDVSPLFAGFFDTRTGPKREAESYDRIAIAAGVPASSMLFLSDVEAELDAAAAAGLRTCQLVRAGDGTQPGDRHAIAATFDEVAAQFGLG